MKRIVTLMLSAALVLGSISAAHAIDVKVKGQWDFAFGWAERAQFERNRDSNDDSVIARHRIRTQVNFIASEYLQGVLMFEIGNLDWGHGGTSGRSSGGGLDADGVNVETKRAYLDWIVPNTDLSIRMGIQGLTLPHATGLGNPVFDADVAAVVASYRFSDMVALTGFWARPFNQYLNDDDRSLDDEVDMFGLVLPITGDGWSITPWGVYARVGSASGIYEYLLSHGSHVNDKTRLDYRDNESTNAWWAGGAISLNMFDPLIFNVDVMYGRIGRNEIGFNSNYGLPSGTTAWTDFESRGWFISANLDYKFEWGTPGIFGWWSTGDDRDDVTDGKFGRIPVIGIDGGFAPTSFGMAGATGIASDGAVSDTGVGTWGIGIQIADLSFIEDLSHVIRVAYYRGTNDKEVPGLVGDRMFSGEEIYMTSKDKAWEVNFDHKYQIYENLAAYLELGYINLDMSESVWGRDYKDKDAWKAQLLFQYNF